MECMDETTNLVTFQGRRSRDLTEDEAKYWVDFDVITQLQSKLLPSLERAILFLDILLILPLLPASGHGWVCPVPFRLHILEDMLHQECWAEDDSDEEPAATADDGPEEEIAQDVQCSGKDDVLTPVSCEDLPAAETASQSA